MSDIYFTVTGLHHYYGDSFLEKEIIVYLKKEKYNEYDKKGFKIVAKSAGKTTIKVEMPNEISDEVTVNVKPKTVEKPEPRILIDGTVWDMNIIEPQRFCKELSIYRD